jgi:hypothetical protein
MKYRRKWTQHSLSMKDIRILNVEYEYIPTDRRNIGRTKQGRKNKYPFMWKKRKIGF